MKEFVFTYGEKKGVKFQQHEIVLGLKLIN